MAEEPPQQRPPGKCRQWSEKPEEEGDQGKLGGERDNISPDSKGQGVGKALRPPENHSLALRQRLQPEGGPRKDQEGNSP